MPGVPRELRLRPFRGSAACAAGLITHSELRRAQWRRLFPDVHIDAEVALDQWLWCSAALLYAGPAAAISGRTAASLWGAPVGRPADPIEITVGSRSRKRYQSPRLRIVRAQVRPDEITEHAGIRLTAPERTILDLARSNLRDESVITAENCLRRRLTSPETFAAYAVRLAGTRPGRLFDRAVALAEPRSESPMETRCRLTLIDGGLPAPAVQVEVRDEFGTLIARLDLAYEEAKVGLEYEGDHHRDRATFQRDLNRLNRLAALGWTILRVGPRDIYREPGNLVMQVKRLLAARTHDRRS